MSGHWIFTHDRMLDPSWTPGPGQKWATDAPLVKCEVTSIRGDKVYFKYLGTPGGGVFIMSRERWETMAPVEVPCADCGWDNLVATDCCEQPVRECRTTVMLDGAGEPDVRVCRRNYGCDQ